MRIGSIESFGRKLIKAADSVAAGAERVSGAVKGAAVGAKTAPTHPYLMPVLIGVGAFLALHLLMNLKRKR